MNNNKIYQKNISERDILKNLLLSKNDPFKFRESVNIIAEYLLNKYIINSNNKIDKKNTIALMPIMRAGIYFLQVFQKLNPDKIYFIDIKRKGNNVKNISANITYKTFKDDEQNIDIIYILEPMIATFNTISVCIESIKKVFNPKEIIIFSVFSSKISDKKILKYKGMIKNFSLINNLDLNEKGYILIPNPINENKFETLDFGDECSGT